MRKHPFLKAPNQFVTKQPRESRTCRLCGTDRFLCSALILLFGWRPKLRHDFVLNVESRLLAVDELGLWPASLVVTINGIFVWSLCDDERLDFILKSSPALLALRTTPDTILSSLVGYNCKRRLNVTKSYATTTTAAADGYGV